MIASRQKWALWGDARLELTGRGGAWLARVGIVLEERLQNGRAPQFQHSVSLRPLALLAASSGGNGQGELLPAGTERGSLSL